MLRFLTTSLTVYINYQTVKMVSGTGNKNTIEADPEQTAVRIAIGYNF